MPADSAPLFRLVQLNDAHLIAGTDPDKRKGRLAAAMREIMGGERFPVPDIVLLGGDLVDAPSEENYRTLRSVIQPLRKTVLLDTAGNHEVERFGEAGQ